MWHWRHLCARYYHSQRSQADRYLMEPRINEQYRQGNKTRKKSKKNEKKNHFLFHLSITRLPRPGTGLISCRHRPKIQIDFSSFYCFINRISWITFKDAINFILSTSFSSSLHLHPSFKRATPISKKNFHPDYWE